jgi:ATP-dependent helicase/nuclease subunit B
MLNQTNVFNIPANYHFFKSLLNWLEKRFDNQLAEIKIFLPNRRSCREFSELFLQKNQAVILPKIKAVSDLSYEDFFDFLPNDEAKKIIDELLQIKLVSGIDYLFFLSLEIQKQHQFGQIDFAQAFKIALRLQDLFNEIEREEIDLSKLENIDDSDLSKHRQITLEFLKNFHVQIKNSLLKQNIFFESSYQNFVFEKFVKLLELYGSKVPLVIAGSTGSVSSSKKLIKAISQQQNGYVVLHALSKNKKLFEEENHPHFFLNQLLKFLEITKNNVTEIAEEKFLSSDGNRQNLLELLMLPSEEILHWQKPQSFFDLENAQKDLAENFRFISAKDEIEEVRIILKIVQQTLPQKKNIAIVSNNQKFCDLLKLELQQYDLPFNDSRNLGIFNAKLVQFLLLIIEFVESDFNSSSLLALLKNPLCFYSFDQKTLQEFEIEILRKERVRPGFIGIAEKLKNSSNKNLQSFFVEF